MGQVTQIILSHFMEATRVHGLTKKCSNDYDSVSGHSIRHYLLFE